MTLDRYEPASIELAQDVAVRRLGEWAQSAEAAHRVAEQLVKTSFVPEGFRGKPYEATAAILAGLEVGLSPMAALRSFDVIQGTAAPRAITLRAIVQSHGHEMELVESTASRCKMRGRRSGATSWTAVDWTMDRARSLGVTGKQNWKTQPQAMLVARATSELARLIAADAILGIGYSAEEVADGAGGGVDIPADMTVAEPPSQTNGKKRMSRKARETPPETDPVLAELLDEEEEIARGDKPSDAQTKRVMAVFGEMGFGGDAHRDDRLAITSAFAGRTIDTWKNVTHDEASQVIDALDRWQAGDIDLVLTDTGWEVQAADPPPHED
jgi:hypothetical protein